MTYTFFRVPCECNGCNRISIKDRVRGHEIVFRKRFWPISLLPIKSTTTFSRSHSRGKSIGILSEVSNCRTDTDDTCYQNYSHHIRAVFTVYFICWVAEQTISTPLDSRLGHGRGKLRSGGNQSVSALEGFSRAAAEAGMEPDLSGGQGNRYLRSRSGSKNQNDPVYFGDTSRTTKNRSSTDGAERGGLGDLRNNPFHSELEFFGSQAECPQRFFFNGQTCLMWNSHRKHVGNFSSFRYQTVFGVELISLLPQLCPCPKSIRLHNGRVSRAFEFYTFLIKTETRTLSNGRDRIRINTDASRSKEIRL